jgi:FkbM family methyltransferase
MMQGLLDTTRRVIRRFARPEFSEADLVRRHFAGREPGTMLDVGAHYGESHAPYLNRGWSVLAFEPDPSNRARIATQSAAGRLELLECAVGERSIESADFYASDESTGVSTLVPFIPSHRPVCQVQVRTLSEVCAEQRIERCDFLKIDTEGHDLFVLRGFPWDTLRPEVILCEFEDRKTMPLGYDYRDLADFMVARGYTVFLSEWAPIQRYGVPHTWRRIVQYPAPLLHENGWGNFIAFREGAVLPGELRGVASGAPAELQVQNLPKPIVRAERRTGIA